MWKSRQLNEEVRSIMLKQAFGLQCLNCTENQAVNKSQLSVKYLIIKQVNPMIAQSPIANSQQNKFQQLISLKRTFELGSSLGKLMVQINYFGKYFFVIVTYASVLKIDGQLQISYPTPYQSKPIVLNLVKEINANDELTRRLTIQLGIPVVLSLNIDFETNKKGEQQLFQGIVNICKSFLQNK